MGEAAAVGRDGATRHDDALRLVDEALALTRTSDRSDLTQRLEVAKVRLVRPGTVVVVVGEFKQGKSSLVNALLGHDACPVDDDLATSVLTFVHHAEAPVAVARRQTEDGIVTEEVPLEEVRDHVTEAGNPGNERGIERLDLGVPSELLADGLVMVDTPGMGGLGAGHAASTLGFLPYADALLFVTDASQELTRPEIELLARAVGECPVVVTCLTKVDLHPEWRRIADLDRGHLADAGIASDVVPVSATMHSVARSRGDPQLEAESGVPVVLERLHSDVVTRAQRSAAERAAAQVAVAIDHLDAAAASELDALRDPERARQLTEEVAEARQRLEHLRGPGAGWSTVLGDRITDLDQRTTHDLRRAVRELSRGLDDDVAELATDEDWQQLARTMQQRTAELVAELFATVEEEGRALRTELRELLDAEGVVLPGISVEVDFDVAALWAPMDEHDDTGLVDRLGSGLSAMRQAQSGVIDVFGMLGRLLPAAATSLLASNPILLGAGVLMGGKALVEQRRRRVTERRHETRRALRQFLEDLQFELAPVLADAVRDLHRTLRDAVGATVDELRRTWTETGQRARQALEATTEERAQRVPELEARRARLGRLRAEVDEVGATATTTATTATGAIGVMPGDHP